MLKNFLREKYKKKLIKQFNDKWQNKEIYICDKIFSEIGFVPHKINMCCHCTKKIYMPPTLYSKKISNFHFNDYIENIDQLLIQNQTNNSHCKGCRSLKKEFFKAQTFEKNINFFTISHFFKCNSNCVYCGNENKEDGIKYEILPIIKRLIENDVIADNCIFQWGGGEPLLCEEFDKLVDFLKERNYPQAINSSGIIFSEKILEGLKNKTITLQISPDAATEETYLKIKRQKNFHKVWENIKKYAEFPENLYIKFIIFKLNNTEEEIYKFIELCKETGVKNIVIDTEFNSENGDGSNFGKITKTEVELAILMKNLAIENNLNYTISYQWKDENKYKIENGN